MNEFIILIPEVEGASAVKAAERLRLSVADHLFPFGGDALHKTISLGMFSVGPGALPDLEQAIKNADRALYTSKETGRNRVTLWH